MVMTHNLISLYKLVLLMTFGSSFGGFVETFVEVLVVWLK